ncbi:Beta-lactamase-related protein [Penicillium canariense]|uniref:Beta-lactamase-related protein n=1 Tax=Penicillium canariense TaxID=189055 RepID=A0A9W9HZ32_9EURO|nr:Beta-lactamase-related protein [Penicillium canariense]KAJ5160438.1 Beta-lactamase-related protein [Penicillium canariense]
MNPLLFLPLLSLGAYVAAKPNACPIFGPAFPAPTELGSDPIFVAATQNLTAQLKQGIESGALSGNSISVQIFSGSDSYSAYSLFHTDDSVRNGSVGVREVNDDTVFRIGSISKLWTMLLYMTFKGTRHFGEPVSKYVPELRNPYNGSEQVDQIDYVNWDEVTIGELASHQAGIPRDYAFMDMKETAPPEALAEMGLPPLPISEKLPCEFFRGLLDTQPIAATSSTPVYSNAGYQVLGYALEAIAQKPYQEILMERIIKPLGLTHSSYDTPDPSLGVVPLNLAASQFNLSIGDAGPAGGIYSSPKDMATFGRAILANTLVDSTMTRRWMKPASHTASLQVSVGHPWEIMSFSEPRLIDVYSKAGNIGMYNSIFALSPDHNIGFAILTAGTGGFTLPLKLGEQVADIMLPALEQIAKNQATRRFTGTYALNKGTSNSSITIVTDGEPGLKITEWISNSVDMGQAFAAKAGLQKDPSLLSMRLQPTGLKSPGRVSFSAVIQGLSAQPIPGTILSSCLTWLELDSYIYGNVGIPEFEFNLNKNGEVVSLTPRALRITLPKVQGLR